MYCSAVYDIDRLRKSVTFAQACRRACEAVSRRSNYHRTGETKTHRDAAANRDADGDD